MGFIRGIIGLALAISFTVFAVANRHDVDLIWSPAAPALKTPLYLVALGMLVFGFLLGSFMVWLNSLPVRWEKHKQSQKIKKLERELGDARKPVEPEPANTETLLLYKNP